MNSLGGGVVRFSGISWIECPEQPEVVGECTVGGTIELLADGRVTERFDVRPGDELLVTDGVAIGPDTPVIHSNPFAHHLRADLDAGVAAIVRWGEPLVESFDEVTGLSRAAFAPGNADVEALLTDDEARQLASVRVPRHARPMAAEGERVHRGDLLARLFVASRDDVHFSGGGVGIEALRAFLDARSEREGVATVAPIDGRVERVEPRYIFLRSSDGRLRRVWRGPSRRREPVAGVGDEVCAGDMLDDGVRSHHHLLVAWGEERLSQHMVEELEVETARRSLGVPRVYWALVVRAMLDWRRVLRPFDTGLRRHRVLSRRAFEVVQRETVARGGEPATAAPVLRGFRTHGTRACARAPSLSRWALRRAPAIRCTGAPPVACNGLRETPDVTETTRCRRAS